jgi:type II secretory pathway pseudopilin PulG
LLIVVAIIGVLAAIAVPSLFRARITGNETSAIASLRSMSSAEMIYASVCGKGGYAVTFAALALGPAGSAEGFLSLAWDARPLPPPSLLSRGNQSDLVSEGLPLPGLAPDSVHDHRACTAKVMA